MSWVTRVLVVACVLAACGKKPPAQAPKQDERVQTLEADLAKAKEDLQKEHDAADALRKSEAEKADEAKKLQDKLAEVVGQAGEVTTADGAVKLELVDQILFAVGEADLTDKGREVLAKVGAALKDVDKQIWVQGHTDDQPIYVKKAKPEPPKKVDPKAKAKPGKPAPAKKDGSDAVLAFMTNWELSAARALTVVHYLQDDAKLDPTRLAAVAFSQYRPVSKQKAKNRRIEIVLYPRVAIQPK
ncbi:MAG: OmpA family protein [Kofleriaceae bacterium]